MPQFQLTAPDGRTVTVEGAEPPSDADADQIFSEIPAKVVKPPLSSMEGLFAGVDKMDKWLGSADAGALNSSLADNPDIKGAKARAANVALLSSQYGLDAAEIAGKLPVYRKDYAAQVLGITEDLDDNAFYAKVGAHITTEKAQGVMMGQLSGALFDAVRTGKPFSQTYEAFRGANLENAGYVKGRDEYYRGYARQQWAAFRTKAIQLAEPIERLSAHMSSFKGESAFFADEAKIAEREDIITMLAALPEQDRELVMDFASGAVSAQSDEQKEQGFGSKLAGKARRGVGQLAESVTGMAERTTAGALDALENVDESRPAIDQMQRPTGGFDFLTRSQGPITGDLEATGELGPVESVVADRQRIERGITQRIVGEVDPMRAGGWLSQGILDAAESTPRMLVSLSAPGIALNLTATKQEIRGRYEDQGLSAADADTLSSIASVPYVALDFVSAKMAFKGRLPGLEKFLTAPTASLARLGGRAALVGGAEAVEQFGQEVAQDLTEPAVQSVASVLSASVPEVNWTEQFKGIKNAAPETFAAILPLVLIGTGTATFKDRAYGREYLKNHDALRAVGFSEETTLEIMEAPTPEQAGAIMRQEWDERKPSSEFIKMLNERAIKQREEMGQTLSESQKALMAKYPELASMGANSIPVEIRKKDGRIIPATMSGYQETFAQKYGEGEGIILKPNVGVYSPQIGGLSHAAITPGDEIISPIPTPMQWQAGVRDAEAEMAQVNTETRQLEQVQQQPMPPEVTEETAGEDAQATEQPPAPQIQPVVSKVPDVGYVVTDKATGAPLGSAPTAEGAAQIVQDVKADQAMEGSPTSTKNAVTDEERAKRGLPKAMQAGKREFGAVWDQATRILDQNANAAEQLVAVLEQKPRATTDLENALLLHRQIELQNEFDKLAAEQQQAQQSGDEGDIARTNAALQEVSDRLLKLYNVERAVGTETGRGLAARRMLANENYSLARMVTQRRVANEGRELTKEQQAETEAMNKKIAALEAELADYKQQLSDAQAETAPRRERKPPKPREPGKVLGFLSKQAAEARERIKARLSEGRVNAGLDPLDIADHAIVGAEYLARRVTDFSKWSAEMVKEFGDYLTPHLAEIFDRAKQVKKLHDIENRVTDRIAELERQIRDETVFSKTPDKTTSPEIEAKRAKIEELTERRDNIRDLLQPREEHQKRPTQTPEEKRLVQLEREIAKVKKQIDDKAPFSPTPEQPVQTDKTRELEVRLNALREERQNLRDTIQAKSYDAPVVITEAEKEAARLDREIERIEKQLADRAPFSAERKEGEKAPENEGKRRLLDLLKQQRENLRDELQAESYDAPVLKTEAEKQRTRLEREIKNIEAQIRDRAPFAKTQEAAEIAPENKDLAARLNALKEERQNIRDELQAADKESPEAIRLKSFKTRSENAIAELERRLGQNDFSERPKPTPLELDDRAREIQARLDIAKLEYQRALERDRYNRLSKLGKAARNVMAGWDAARNLITTGELSFILRQGLPVVLSHPVLAAQSLGDTFKALASSKELAHAINLRVLDHPDAKAAKAAKLHLVSIEDELNKQEETQIGRWAGDIPVLRNFNQAATVFLNRVRFDAWRAMRDSLGQQATPELDKQLAKYVNEATGRGTLPGLEKSAVTMARLLFAPRYLASRFQFAVGNSFWQASGPAKRVIAGEYARAMAGMAVYYGLLYAGASAMAGDDEERKPRIGTDPRSADFGKIIIGENRLDPLAGLSQAIVFMSRGAHALASEDKADIVTSTGRERQMTGEDVARFARSKLHPLLGAGVNLATGKDLGGNEATLVNQAVNLMAPITYGDIIDAFQREEIPEATAFSLLMLLGVGVQNYERREPPERTVNP